jgi:8-oxo-dGTP diphosphatase
MGEQIPLHVVAAVMIHNDKILGCRRGSHKDAAGMWEFPGGKVEPGESPKQALSREIWEELSLEVKPWRMLDRSLTHVNERLSIDLECWVVFLDHAPNLISSDHDAFVWLSPDELSQYSWAKPDWPAVKKLSAHSNLRNLWDSLSEPGRNLD